MRVRGILLIMALAAGVSAGVWETGRAAQPETLPQASGIEDAVVNVAAKVGKAVVSISTEHKIPSDKNKRVYFNSPFGDEEFFRRFFDEFFGDMPERDYRQVALGSGVIVDPQGYILTNEHVVEDADKITVTLPDGREFKGEVKGRDPRSDLAIIKIDANNLSVVQLGESESLKIGQWVLAIGNPFGFAMQNPEPTVTVGVVSALHRSLGRSISRERDYNDLIQTDAAINPGNSGGPLVNLKGEVVGINAAIFSTNGGYQGIGFAIPINTARRIISRLIEGKKIVYGWLGITVQDMSVDLAKHLGLKDKNGALIATVLPAGPAEKAGMKEGDIIRKFDNTDVNNVRELLSLVGRAEPGRKVKATLLRNNKELTLNVEVGERPDNLEESDAGATRNKSKKWRGLEVSESQKGLVISEIEQGSAADDAGLVAGEVIQEIDKQPVKTLSDYQKAIKGVKGDCLVKTSRGYFLIKGD
ncbi:MAG: Do family serine endopeptidase [Candidatus Omnitrophota bacterium]